MKKLFLDIEFIYPCRLQNCHLFLTDSLTKTWKDYLSEERSDQKMDFTQKDMTTLKKGAGLVATVASKVRRRKGTTVSKEDLVHVSHMIQSQDVNNNDSQSYVNQ